MEVNHFLVGQNAQAKWGKTPNLGILPHTQGRFAPPVGQKGQMWFFSFFDYCVHAVSWTCMCFWYLVGYKHLKRLQPQLALCCYNRRRQTFFPLRGASCPTLLYLGVNIQDNMQWESHIDSITKKASKTLGFIRRNLNIGNKKTKETAYKALVRPLLEYAAPVWDPYTANDIEALEKIQRRAARWVTNRHRQTPLC